MKNSFDERNLKEINNWLKASKKIALATVIRTWGHLHNLLEVE